MDKSKKYSLPAIKSLMSRLAVQHGIPEQVSNTWNHCRVVYKLADQIAKLAAQNGYKVDRDYIKTASYIHDMGRMVVGSKGSKVLQTAIYHGLEGYKILKKQGYPEKLARICLAHIGGAGLDKVTNRKYKFFKNKDTLAKSMEEKIIAYADCRTDYNKKTKKEENIDFIKAYNRFKHYPHSAGRLKRNHAFIQKITKGKIK